VSSDDDDDDDDGDVDAGMDLGELARVRGLGLTPAHVCAGTGAHPGHFCARIRAGCPAGQENGAGPPAAGAPQRRLPAPSSPGADVGGMSPVLVQMWAGARKSGPVPIQMLHGRTRFQCRCGQCEPRSVPLQM
jgi:hypothetical protein